eukprot:5203045-Pyramimonas_sp.AAC.1
MPAETRAPDRRRQGRERALGRGARGVAHEALLRSALAAFETRPARADGVTSAAQTDTTGAEIPLTFTFDLTEASEGLQAVVLGHVGQGGA